MWQGAKALLLTEYFENKEKLNELKRKGTHKGFNLFVYWFKRNYKEYRSEIL